MRRKSVIAIVLLITMVFVLAGCNYVSRPVGAGNNSSDNSSILSNLLKQPTKTIYEETEVIYKDPVIEDTEDEGGDDAPVEEPITSPFQTTTDVFEKIEALLQQIADKKVDTGSATGVSDELMRGRTVYLYTPYDISSQDDTMIKSVANKLNMTVVVNNLNQTGAMYSAQIRKIVKSDAKADIMFVDQNIWGDIQYYCQPIDSFVNFEIGDKIGSFYGSMSANYSIADSFFPSLQTLSNAYVAAGIGAPYLLAYNKSNLVTTGKLAGGFDPHKMENYKEVVLADPVKMYNDGTWGLKAMKQMLIDSTINKCVGLGSLKDITSSVNWWFGCDNVPAFSLNIYKQSALASSTDDYFSVAGHSRFTLNTIQDMYWNTTGANGLTVAQFVDTKNQDKLLSKLFNNYIGTDSVNSYAMVGIEAHQFKDVVAAAGDAKWDVVGYPYGTIAEDIIRSSEPGENGQYMYNDDQDVLKTHSAGWASGFAVLDRCANPAIALRFAEAYTLAWQENYESSFKDLMTDAQWDRYIEMKKNMGVTFYTSMISHSVEMSDAYPGNASMISSDALSASSEFATTPELFTQLIFNKDVAIGSYNPSFTPKWSDYFTPENVDGMAGALELARVMFNY